MDNTTEFKNKSVEYADKRVSISEDEFTWSEVNMAYDAGAKSMLSLTTDKLFDMLPPFLNIDGELYHFHLVKNKRISISYEKSESEGGDYLAQTFRSSDESLQDVCRKMVEWLLKFEYVKYMPYGYKKKYEDMFNVIIEHSRGFDQ